jgi:hypothetical protein
VVASKKLQRYALMTMLRSLNAKALQMYSFKIKAVVVKWLQQTANGVLCARVPSAGVCNKMLTSVMSFGIMFWGNSPHSPIIFKMQKRVLRILGGVGYRDFCRELFKELKILTL